MIINYQVTIPVWKGKILSYYSLSRAAQKKYHRLRQNNKSYEGQFPPILAEKSGRGHMVFMPPEWGEDKYEFQIAMELYANTPEIMKVI